MRRDDSPPPASYVAALHPAAPAPAPKGLDDEQGRAVIEAIERVMHRRDRGAEDGGES